MEVNPPFFLPASWPTYPMGEVCRKGGGDIQTGPFGNQLHKSDYVAVGIPSIMPVNIGDNQINDVGIARITATDAQRLGKYLVRAGDIVYSRRGDVERRALVREKEDGWLCGTGCLRVRFGEGVVIPEFGAYYLGHPAVREWIVRHAIGATMPNLNTKILSALPFVLPPLPEQQAIANILGTLDDKIDLNRRMNETLEAMARAIFKSWFIDFDGHTEFEDSELGPIPKGWRVGKLADVADNPRRTIQPSDVPSTTPYIGLHHMPRRCIALDAWGRADEVGSGKSWFKKGEILFGKLRPYFHKVGIAPVDGVCSTDILVVVPKSAEWHSYVMSLVSSKDFVDYTDTYSTGTKMPRTNWKDMGNYPLAIPPKSLAKAFQDITEVFYHRIGQDVHQNYSLASLRDALLPKLISGELSLTETEKMVAEAI
ncbi:restriction endonuclease subunit S [Oceanidesulfovibrio indonesiensis]|uniref:Restriction endonuclease subunit S n=1 Tax=Oceanidesulfovibrio indonesiensis TaxID=54767 RepID=A0A7M3MA93_9BACT|nr:restriction endonuclease subunit S [Oceanidesulfovibrio indonesiensis]TVM14536.1 restriction endonuclease subunit S [Oceanidesulfovibrio indonesiensis]